MHLQLLLIFGYASDRVTVVKTIPVGEHIRESH